MDEEDVLKFVVQAFVEFFEDRRNEDNVEPAALARESGVPEHHISVAIDKVRAKRWVYGWGPVSSDTKSFNQMKAFLDKLPKRKRTQDELEHSIAAALLPLLDGDSTVSRLAAESDVKVGNVRLVLDAWIARSSGLQLESEGEAIHYDYRTRDFLEAIIAEPIEWRRDGAVPSVQRNGDDVRGNKVTVAIHGSTVGAFAVGEGSTATGTVNVRGAFKAEFQAAIRTAQHALVEQQDDLRDGEHEALFQLLKMLKGIEIEVGSLVESQGRAKAAFDAFLKSEAGETLRGTRSSGAEKVFYALVASPVLANLIEIAAGIG